MASGSVARPVGVATGGERGNPNALGGHVTAHREASIWVGWVMTDNGRSDLLSQTRIDEILFHWEEARERGQAISPAELCRDCPELEPEVVKQIENLRVWERFDDSPPPVDGDRRPTQPPLPSP